MKIPALSILCLSALFASGLACDQSSQPEDPSDARALFFVDGEPIYSMDELSEEDEELLLQLGVELEGPQPEPVEDVGHRAACVADCGSTMMSVSGSQCVCRDGSGCWVRDGGQQYTWSCAQQ